MKKHIFFSALVALTLSSNAIAQDFDTNPVVKYENQEQKLKFTVGARFMADGAYYHTDYTPMKSGVAITDARIRTSMSYDDWYFYADFDFSKGKFAQKNIFLQYALNGGNAGYLKAGYYNDPATMGNNTSRGSLHFISRAASVNALAPVRQLGLTYKYYNDHFFANQGVFAENIYNNQEEGYQGVTLGGRWLYMPVNDDDQTLHFGAAFRYARINTGTLEKGVKKTSLSFGSSVQTYVDPFQFTQVTLPWAKNEFNANVEAFYRNEKMFVRGEYLYKAVSKQRDDKALFDYQLGGSQSWTTLESWQKGNPLGTNRFQGGYVELGYQLCGNGYKYDKHEGVLKGFDGRSLEIVARYNYLQLNDIKDGELYILGRDQYYPAADNGIVSDALKDYPATSKSVGGGNMHSVTLGLNYSFNQFAQFLLEYNYNRLDRDKYQYDKNIHGVQARLMFSF